MAASDFFAKQGWTGVSLDSTFGTTGTIQHAAVDPNASSITPARAVIPIKDERTRPWYAVAPILGPKSATAKVAIHMRPPTARLANGVVGTDNYLSVMLKAIMGGESRGEGSIVATGTSATVFVVDAGDGPQFTAGAWVAVDIGGTLEARRVTSVATDTVTVRPAFSAAPSIGAVVINSSTFYLTSTNTQSVTLQHAKANDTNFSWTAVGGTGNVSFGFDTNKLVQAVFDLKFPRWTFGAIAAQSPAITVAEFSETLASHMLANQAYTYLFPASVTTVPTHYPFEQGGVEYSVACGNEHIMEMGGQLENAVGVVRMPDRDAHRIKTKVRADSQWEAVFTAGTLYSIMTIIPTGSGTTKRFVVFDAPSCVLVEQPTYEGDRLTTNLVWQPIEDTITAGSTQTASSPVKVAVI